MSSVYNHIKNGVWEYSIRMTSKTKWHLTTTGGTVHFNPKDLPHQLVEYKTLKNERADLMNQIKQIEGAKGIHKLEVNALKSRIKELKNEIASLRGEAGGKDASSTLNEAVKPHLKDVLQKQINQVAEIDDLHQVIDSLKRELEQMDKTGEDAAAAPYDEIEQLKREKLDLIGRIDELEKENDALSSETSHLSEAQPFASRSWGGKCTLCDICNEF